MAPPAPSPPPLLPAVGTVPTGYAAELQEHLNTVSQPNQAATTLALLVQGQGEAVAGGVGVAGGGGVVREG